MRRTPIIILCSANALIAIGLLVICAPKLFKTGNESITPPQLVQQPTDSDLDLWNKALTANSSKEATFYINQIKDLTLQRENTIELLTEVRMNNETKLTRSTIQQLEAIISTFQKCITASKDLDCLISIFDNHSLPIALRAAALRTIIQAHYTFHTTGTFPQSYDAGLRMGSFRKSIITLFSREHSF